MDSTYVSIIAYYVRINEDAMGVQAIVVATTKLFAILWVALLLFALIFSDQLIFSPPKKTYQPTHVEWTTSSGGNRIAMRWHDVPSATQTLLYSHGNAQDIGTIESFAKQMNDQGYNVLVYDYQGYGLSQGQATEQSAYDDVLAAYQWLIDVQKIPSKQIVAFGFSLGGAMAIYLAAHKPVAGLIVQGGFLSAFRVLTRIKLLPMDRFDNTKWLQKIKVPTLFLHGTDDEVVSFWHGQKLYDLLTGVQKYKQWFQGGDHNNLHCDFPGQYFTAIKRFMTSLVSGPQIRATGPNSTKEHPVRHEHDSPDVFV